MDWKQYLAAYLEKQIRLSDEKRGLTARDHDIFNRALQGYRDTEVELSIVRREIRENGTSTDDRASVNCRGSKRDGKVERVARPINRDKLSVDCKLSLSEILSRMD
jgi:hypothetical protein